MSSLRCSNCGYVKSVPVGKTRLTGIGVAAFGVFGWVSFLFAGSGHAFLICCVIFLAGLLMFIYPSSFGKIFSEGQECPRCGLKEWKEVSSWDQSGDNSKPIITVKAKSKLKEVKPILLESKPLRLPPANETEVSRQIEDFTNSSENSRTKEQCIAAAKLSNQSLMFIHIKYMHDVAFCEDLIGSCIDPDKILSYLPMNMRTSEICVVAVAANKDAIKYVPTDRKEIIKKIVG